MNKYVFITGGVCSSLGKGVAAASVGSLIECAGLSVALVKCDPYINVDAGTMSPLQHGEVYVTEDGAEADLDLGTFARFTSGIITKAHSITTGQIYDNVIKNEREGRYNGRAVQVIPHITDEIKRRILAVGMRSEADVVIVEIGGTVGDIESIPFLEAVRQLIREKGHTNALSLHLTLVPTITGGEMKTKPTQHAVKKMQETGIQPDMLLCRTEDLFDGDLQKKIALFCNVPSDFVFTTIDVKKTIYELPVIFHEQKLDSKILERLGFSGRTSNISVWRDFLAKLDAAKTTVHIGIVGKKNAVSDCYKSVREALFHAAVSGCNAEVVIHKIDSAETASAECFDGIDGIVLPGSFGGAEELSGLLAAVRYAREQRIPFLGINSGMHLMAIEAARNILGWDDANSTEFSKDSTHPVISLPEEQAGLAAVGLVKLGNGAVSLEDGSKLRDIYGVPQIIERHRSKYAFDSRYADELEAGGLKTSAFAPDGQAEAFEWTGHPWGIGVQYHPEFASHPSKPHPLFTAFIGAIIGVILSSCSINYNNTPDNSEIVPEFLLANASLTRYEDAKPVLTLDANLLEQYKNSNILFGSAISFTTSDPDGVQTAAGSCGFFSADTDGKMYNLFNNIVIQSFSDQIEIHAEELKWAETQGVMVSGKNSPVSINRRREASETEGASAFSLTGIGFSANTIERTYQFAGEINGTFTSGETGDESSNATVAANDGEF